VRTFATVNDVKAKSIGHGKHALISRMDHARDVADVFRSANINQASQHLTAQAHALELITHNHAKLGIGLVVFFCQTTHSPKLILVSPRIMMNGNENHPTVIIHKDNILDTIMRSALMQLFRLEEAQLHRALR
jgi:hypothetical protein